MSSSSRRRKFISRVRSAFCVAESAVTTNVERERGEERLHLGLAVEVGDRPRGREAEDGEGDAHPDARPEDGRAVGLGQVAALHERGAERDVGEDRDDGREDDAPSRRSRSRTGRAAARG